MHGYVNQYKGGVCVVWVCTATIEFKKKKKKTQDPEFRTDKGFEPFKPF